MKKANQIEPLEQGKKLILAEKYEEALSYFKNLDKKEKNALYSNYIGVIYFLKEDYKNAAEYFKKAIDLEPDNWYPYQKLGQICTIKKIDECAINYFTETLDRNPKNLNALLNLAIIFQNQDKQLAKDLINNALSLDPLSNVGNYLLGSIYLKNKDYDNAEKFFHNVLLNNPRFTRAVYQLASLYFKTGKNRKAINVLTEALELDKKSYLFNLLGLIYLHKFKLEDAQQCFKNAIKIDPENINAWINLSDVYLKANNFESSKNCLKEALDLANKNNIEKSDAKYLAIWINLSNCYENEGNLDFALYCLNNARKFYIDDSQNKLEDFQEDELKMEMLHKISLKIDAFLNNNITPRKPDELFD